MIRRDLAASEFQNEMLIAHANDEALSKIVRNKICILTLTFIKQSFIIQYV